MLPSRKSRTAPVLTANTVLCTLNWQTDKWLQRLNKTVLLKPKFWLLKLCFVLNWCFTWHIRYLSLVGITQGKYLQGLEFKLTKWFGIPNNTWSILYYCNTVTVYLQVSVFERHRLSKNPIACSICRKVWKSRVLIDNRVLEHFSWPMAIHVELFVQ